MKLSKWGKKSSNFQKRLNRENFRQSKNENNIFCLLFFSLQYQIWKANTYSILTNDNQIWTTSVGDLTDSEHKFHITRIEIWASISFELGFAWQRTYYHNNYTCSTCSSMMGSLKLLYTHLQSPVTMRPFTSVRLCKCSQNPHPASRVASNPNKSEQPFF